MWKFVTVIAIGAACSLPTVAVAQQAQQPSSPPRAIGGTSKQAEPQAPQVPHPNQLMIIVRSTLLAVNHANLTGNYSVLRELGTPGFQMSNTPTDLAEIFKALRERNIDLGPVALLDAKLREQPSVNANGQLRLTGFFPSQPEQVNFDLAFYKRNGRWLLDGIALNTTPNKAPPKDLSASSAKSKPKTPEVQ